MLKSETQVNRYLALFAPVILALKTEIKILPSEAHDRKPNQTIGTV